MYPLRCSSASRLLTAAGALMLHGPREVASLVERDAFAKVGMESAYTYEQTWNSTLRLLRVDLGYKIVEKDEAAGYILFEYTDKGTVSNASIELLRGSSTIRVVCQIPKFPSYHEVGGARSPLAQAQGGPRPPAGEAEISARCRPARRRRRRGPLITRSRRSCAPSRGRPFSPITIRVSRRADAGLGPGVVVERAVLLAGRDHQRLGARADRGVAQARLPTSFESLGDLHVLDAQRMIVCGASGRGTRRPAGAPARRPCACRRWCWG